MTTTESETATPPRPETRLELHIQQTAEGSVAATAPVRWCVTPDLIEDLRRRNFVKPQLVMAVRALRQDTYLDRTTTVATQTSVQVVPIDQELTYVSFRRPGSNEIRVVIVDADTDESVERLRKLRRGSREDVFDDDGSLSREFRVDHHKYIEIGLGLNVEVPIEMFAPPPPPWRKKLVKRFFPNQEVDQCHFRKRTILSVLASIYLLTLGQLLKLLFVLVGLFGGFREIVWSNFLHPWKKAPSEILEDRVTMIWFQNRHGRTRLSPLWLINPIVLSIMPLVVFALMQLEAHNRNLARPKGQSFMVHQLSYPGWWQTVGMVDLAILALTVGITALVLLVYVLAELIGRYTGSETRRQRIRRQREAQEQSNQSRILTSLEAMTCTNASVNASLEALPANKRTVHLRASNFKTRVCKPFAR
jgi:hypothetical protein